MAWTIDWPSLPSWTNHDIEPEEVLYEYDGPVVFVATFGAYKVLFSRFDEMDDVALYATGTVSSEVLAALRDGSLSLRGAILREPCHVMELDGLQVRRYWACPAADLPQELLPASGRGLSSAIVDAADSYEQLTSYFSVRFSGAKLSSRSMPFSTFKSLVDRVYDAARHIMMPDGFSHAKSATFDFDVFEPAFGSLVISLDKPTLAAGNVRRHLKNPNADIDGVRQNIGNKKAEFFDDLGALVAEAEDRDLSMQFAEDNINLLKNIQEIIPNDDTDFAKVDFNAIIAGERRQLSVTEEVGIRLKRAHDAALGEAAQYVGKITIINSKRATFVMERFVGRELTCDLTKDAFDTLSLDSRFKGGTPVKVAGRFFQRSRRDYMIVDEIELLPAPLDTPTPSPP